MGAPDEKIVRFIRRHHVMTLATCHEGRPWCANVFYVYVPDLNMFVFTSDTATRHGREMTDNERVSASIVLETRIVGRVRGLQIEGSALLTEGTEFADTTRKTYLKRFPYAAVIDLELWVLQPDYMKFTDNTLGFSKKLHWRCDE